MGRAIKGGSTNVSTVIRIIDSTDGTPETGVTSATSGLDLRYRREGAATVSLTESDLSALTDAHSDGGMLHIHEGYYRVDVPDAAFAAGVGGVLITGAVTNMVVIGEYHPIDEPADMTHVSGDATAADNFETMLDGTGGNILTVEQIRVDSSDANGGIYVTNSGGPAIAATTTNTNDHGAVFTGDGTGSGMRCLGGSGGLGSAGFYCEGFDALGVGFSGNGVLNGIAAQASGGNGILGQSNGSNGHGLAGVGNGSGNGIYGLGGATGNGGWLSGGATSGYGLECVADGGGCGIKATAIGAFAGISVVAGATGDGIEVTAGSTSGNAIETNITSGNHLSSGIRGEINAEADTAISDASLATAAALATVDTNVDAILVDTNELQGDWTDGGRLDLIVDAILVDTGTTIPGTITTLQADTDDIQTRLPAALVGGKMDSDATSISGDSTAADRLEALMDGTIVAQVNDASATTTAFAADGFTEATDDHFNGRLITFISGALTGQQTDITDYDAAGGAQGSQQFTVTALTEAPANNDFFVIH